MSESNRAARMTQLERALAEADSLKFGDHERLLLVAQEAGNLAQLLGEARHYAQALVHQAWALANLTRFEASLVMALEALALARHDGYTEIEALAVGVVAANFHLCGLKSDAVYLFEHELRLGESLSNGAVQGMALNDLAVVRMGMGEWDTAFSLLQRAVLLVPPQLHGGVEYSIVHINLAFVCINLRRFDDAFHHAQQVLALAPNAPRVVCDAHLWLASVYLSRDDLAAAQEQVNLARHVMSGLPPGAYNDNVDRLTAELLIYERRDREAAQVLEGMVAMTLERQEIDYAIGALQLLRDVYARLDDTNGSLNTYRRLAEDIPHLQQQVSDLRFMVLRTVFAFDRAALQSELKLERHRSAILERISHEFRTPLAIIQSTADIIGHYGDRLSLEQRRVRLRRVTDQVQRMTAMLEDIVQLLRLDDANPPLLQQAQFYLDDLPRAALAELDRYQLPADRVRLDLLPHAAPLHAAHRALEVVLVHLLANALKFSSEPVTLALAVEHGRLVMQVADHGIGIPPAEQEAVFQPLVRGSNPDEVGGVGIGLALVARLVEHMHGSLELHSAEGDGTTVIVRVPLILSG